MLFQNVLGKPGGHFGEGDDEGEANELDDDEGNDAAIDVACTDFGWGNTFEVKERKAEGWREE